LVSYFFLEHGVDESTILNTLGSPQGVSPRCTENLMH